MARVCAPSFPSHCLTVSVVIFLVSGSGTHKSLIPHLPSSPYPHLLARMIEGDVGMRGDEGRAVGCGGKALS